jgi:hypothetical protein
MFLITHQKQGENIENNNYSMLKINVKCWECLGCNKLENIKFEGLYNCDNFKHSNKTVWCANKAINNFIKTKKVK